MSVHPSLEVSGGGLDSFLPGFTTLDRPYDAYPVICSNAHVETIFATKFRSSPYVRFRRRQIKRVGVGSQKCIYMDTCSFDFDELNEEVLKRYPSHSDQVFSILFVDKYAQDQSFIELNSDESFKVMLGMYEQEKEITIYVTTNKNLGTSNTQQRKKSSRMKIQTRFPNVIAFRTAMNHHAITNEFSYSIEKSDFERFTARCEHEECPWRIHASLMEDKVTFQVRKLVEKHTCTRSNMGGNKHATQAWIASVVTDKLKSDGNVTVGELRKCEDAITYLALNHNKIWSRSKFGTIAKCDYMTNNISEAFNSWIGACRYQPVLDLLDDVREKILKRLDEQRRIATTWNGTLKLGEYEVCRSNDNHAEVKYKGKRWEVILDERKCSCRVWQVKGLPCVHAAAFIAFIRESWEKYVDPYFTIQKFKDAYAFEVATMPGRDQWMHLETMEMMHPPVIKRPTGRPRKNRIVPADESKKRRKCRKCVGLDIFKRHAKIHRLKVQILVKHPPRKGVDGRIQKLKKALPSWGRDRKAQKDSYF
ncbi:transposase, MuDR [Artemisia annua]|uniref:Transposase, MuDR n=1 Tax=Artemisia annua TaxID=35608 RepID=A0A2U1P8Z2_ARTAN|nr:transposase, MuDR [Artemisia annua]